MAFLQLMWERLLLWSAGDILTCLMLCISLYAVSGKKTFEHCGDRTGYVFRTGWPILTFTLFFFVVGMGYSIADRLPMNPDWISRLGLTFIMMLFAGVNEELCYRAIASDVLLPRLWNTKHPFLYTAVISGLVFGIVHVFLGEYNSLRSIVLARLGTGSRKHRLYRRRYGFSYCLSDPAGSKPDRSASYISKSRNDDRF